MESERVKGRVKTFPQAQSALFYIRELGDARDRQRRDGVPLPLGSTTAFTKNLIKSRSLTDYDA